MGTMTRRRKRVSTGLRGYLQSINTALREPAHYVLGFGDFERFCGDLRRLWAVEPLPFRAKKHIPARPKAFFARNRACPPGALQAPKGTLVFHREAQEDEKGRMVEECFHNL